MDAHLADAFADGPAVAEIATTCCFDPGKDPRLCRLVAQGCQPRGELLGLQQDHPSWLPDSLAYLIGYMFLSRSCELRAPAAGRHRTSVGEKEKRPLARPFVCFRVAGPYAGTVSAAFV